MSGRQTLRVRCAHEGCTQTAYYDSMTIAERDRLARQHHARPWRCVRHTRPDEVLTINAPERTSVVLALPPKTWESDRLFWTDEERPGSGNGFAHGPGFKAWADDFPAGTRLIVTARIELPEEPADA